MVEIYQRFVLTWYLFECGCSAFVRNICNLLRVRSGVRPEKKV